MSLEKIYLTIRSGIDKCVSTVLSLVKIVFQSTRIRSFPIAREESCIVLGNGPSLASALESAPQFFNTHPLICVNTFATTDTFTKLKPSYYVLLDPLFWDSGNELAKVTIDALMQKTNWDMTLLLPQKAKKANWPSELTQKNHHINVSYFNYTVYEGAESIGFWAYKHNLAMPQSQYVLVAALFLAINMGFQNIFLLGADHSQHEHLMVNDENRLHLKSIHFHEQKEQVRYQPFYSSYTKKDVFKIDEIFHIWAKVFKGYWNIRRYADHRKRKIYNVTTGSFVDAFERTTIKT